MTSIHMDTFQRPAPYWLRRAEKCKQAGDLRRAAVLERHAARTDPGYAAGPASYALTLRQLHCYEASNREAFAALAYDPSRVALYGLIGQNMIALGHRQEGLDAFSLYFNAPDDGQTVPAPWDGDVYEMEEAYWEPPVQRRAWRAAIWTAHPAPSSAQGGPPFRRPMPAGTNWPPCGMSGPAGRRRPSGMCAAPFVCVRMTHSCPPRRRAFWEGWAERGKRLPP